MHKPYKGAMTPEEQESTFGRPEIVDRAMAESYVERMLKGKPLYRTVEIPGWEPFRMRPLPWDAEARCHAEARRYVEGTLGLDSTKHTDLEGNESTLRIVYEAAFTADSEPEAPMPLAHSLEEWRKFPALTNTNLAILWTEYEDCKLALSSQFEALPENVAMEIVEELKKNRAETPVEHWPRQWLLGLIDFTVSLLRGSTGSKHDTSGSSGIAESPST